MAKLNDSLYFSRIINCAAYIKTLYEFFNWKSGCKYRIRGMFQQKDKKVAIIFDMKETEIFIPQETLYSEQDTTSTEDLLSKFIMSILNVLIMILTS